MDAERRMQVMEMLDYEGNMDVLRTFLDFDISFVCKAAFNQDMDGANRD